MDVTIASTTINQEVWARYCRQSTREQEYSIPKQNEVLDHCFPDISYNSKDYFAEERSAFIPHNRPQFDQLIAKIEAGTVNCVQAWHPDRLARNMDEGVVIINLLRQGKLKKLVFPEKSYSFQNNAEGIRNLIIEFANAEYSSSKSSREVTTACDLLLQTGYWTHQAPLGYKNPETRRKKSGKKKKSNKVITDEVTFPILQRVLKAIAQGEITHIEGLRQLNEDHHLFTKRGTNQLSRKTWRDILTNPFYCGKMRTKRFGIVDGGHTPMITEEEFKIIQQQLATSANPHKIIHDYPYKKLLRCGQCGGSIRSYKTNKPGKDYIYYHCTKNNKASCPSQGTTEIKVIEQAFDNKIKTLEVKPEYLQWGLDNFIIKRKDRQTWDQLNLQRTELAIKRYTAQLGGMLRRQALEDSDDFDLQEILDEEIKKVQINITNLQKEFKQRSEVIAKVGVIPNLIQYSPTAILRYWLFKGDPTTKTQVAKLLGSHHIIKDRNIQINLQLPFFLTPKVT